MWIPAYLVLSIKRPQNPPVFRWKGKRNSRVYNAGRRGRKVVKRSSKQAADSRGAKSREGRAEKPTTTTFLGSTTRTPHPGPFFLPPQSPVPPPLLAHRKYFSLTLFESYQWQAGRQASERWWRSGRNRRLLRLPARSRRASARPWVLAAPSSPSAGGLPTSNRRCSVRRLPHIATTAASPSDSPCFLFSLSPHHTLAAPGSSVVGGGGVGPAFGVFFFSAAAFPGFLLFVSACV